MVPENSDTRPIGVELSDYVSPCVTAGRKQQRKLRMAVIALLAAAIVAIGYCTPLLDVLFLDQPFSSEDWLKADVRLRGRMARDLVSSGWLREKTMVEVQALLGPPDVKGSGWMVYRVDIGYRWIIQPYLYELLVEFDKPGLVYVVLLRPRRHATIF